MVRERDRERERESPNPTATDLSQADVHHTERPRPADPRTAVHHCRAHVRLQHTRATNGHQELQEDVGSLGDPKVRPADVVEVEDCPCLFSLLKGGREEGEREGGRRERGKEGGRKGGEEERREGRREGGREEKGYHKYLQCKYQS